jgi:hypothetical protein
MLSQLAPDVKMSLLVNDLPVDWPARLLGLSG